MSWLSLGQAELGEGDVSPDPGLLITLLVTQRRKSEDQKAFVAMMVMKKEQSLTRSDLYLKNPF